MNDYVWTLKSSNLRAEPDKNSKSLGTVPQDTVLKRIGLHENGWSMVEYNDMICFISFNCVTANPTATPTVTPTFTPLPTKTPTPTLIPVPTKVVIPEITGDVVETTVEYVDDGKVTPYTDTTTIYSSGQKLLVREYETGYRQTYQTEPDGTLISDEQGGQFIFFDYPDGTQKIINNVTNETRYYGSNGKFLYGVYRYDGWSEFMTFYFRFTNGKDKEGYVCNSDGSLNEWSGTKYAYEVAFVYEGAVWFKSLETRLPSPFYIKDGPYYDY